MKKTLFFLLLGAVLAAILIPLSFKKDNETINQTINISAALISSIASLITLLIALFLFNKYGVESPLFTKSSSNVFILLEKIKETNISFSSSKLYFSVQMSDPFKYSQFIEPYYSEKIAIPQNYLDGLSKFYEISDNPFTPPSISQKLDLLRFQVLSFDIDTNRLDEYLKIQIVGSPKVENQMFGRFNMQDLTVFEFLNFLNDISSEIKTCIQTNSTIPVNLNL